MGTTTDQTLKIRRALVTGGGGFIGGAVARQLLASGVETRILGRHSYPAMATLGADCRIGDLANAEEVARAVEGVDAVFHVAALAGIWGKWRDYQQTNVLGTENVISACLRGGVAVLVQTSTPSVVFAEKDILAGDEDLPYPNRFLCHYARSKVLAERMVLEANSTALHTCALRPHLVFGPGDPHLLPRLLAAGRKRALKRVGSGNNVVDISYVDNVAHAHLLAAANLAGKGTAAGRAYFISQGEPVNLWQWINELFGQLGIPKVSSTISFSAAYRLGWALEGIYRLLQLPGEPRMTRFVAEQLARSHYFSIARATRDFGYRPLVSTEEGLQRTVQWLQRQ
jgi:nucleoside-diphosphate-sugar epimerase